MSATNTHRNAHATSGCRPARRTRRALTVPPAAGEQTATEHRRILELLRRGAGITQILSEIARPGDTAADSLTRTTHLRSALERLAHSSDPRLRMAPRRFTRTLTYLDHRLGLLQAEAEWAQRTGPHGQVMTDSHGVQVQVQDGVPSFTIVGARDELQRIIGEELRRQLGARWPLRRITVVPPAGWAPTDDALRSLAYAIHVDDAY